jgi:fatty acid synthase
LFSVGQTGKISWKENWVAFMDNLLQIKILQKESRDLFIPTFIQKLTIDAKRHAADVRELDTKNEDIGELVTFQLW